MLKTEERRIIRVKTKFLSVIGRTFKERLQKCLRSWTARTVQQITVTPYFSNCSSVVTAVKSCSLAAAMMNRSQGSL